MIMPINIFRILFFVTLFMTSPSFCLSGIAEHLIQFNDDIMTANIHEISIKKILNDVRKEKGIWYTEKTNIDDQTITVYFKNLPLEKGLKRILFNFNYAFYFDEEQRIQGIIILGNKNKNGNAEHDKNYLIGGIKNNNQQEIIKENKMLVFPTAGERLSRHLSEDSKGIGQFPPSAESLANQDEKNNFNISENPFERK